MTSKVKPESVDEEFYEKNCLRESGPYCDSRTCPFRNTIICPFRDTEIEEVHPNTVLGVDSGGPKWLKFRGQLEAEQLEVEEDD